MILLLKNTNRYLCSTICLIYFLINFQNAMSLPNECSSDICQKEASFFLNNINPEIDPCDDFYQFACGNFIKNAIIPEDEDKVSVTSITQKNLRSQMVNDVKEIKDDDVEAFKKVKQIYHNCLKNPGEEATNTLLDLLKKYGGMPALSGDNWDESQFNWLTTVTKARNDGFRLQFPIQISTTNDPKNSSRLILVISNPAIKVDKMFFSNESNARQTYFDYMVDILTMFGVNRDVAIEEMNKCLDFEIQLFKIETPWEELDNDQIPDPMTIKELSEKNPSIPWLDLIRKIYEPSGITVDENELVIVYDPSAIDKLEQLIATTPKKEIANFILWQVIFDAIDYLSDDFLNRQSQYQGIENRVDRVAKCGNDALDNFPAAISALYVRNRNLKHSRKNVMELVNNVKKEIQKIMQQNQWLDNATRDAALEKLKAMGTSVGIYDEYFDDNALNNYYQDFEVSDGTYLRSAFNLSTFYHKIQDRKLRQIDSQDELFLHVSPSRINAYYIKPNNYIELAPPMLQQPFFHVERPQYLNYGSLGWIIGQSIFHGFNTVKPLKNKDGVDMNWSNDDTEKTYLQKAQCLIDQYSNYTVEEVGRNLNTKITKANDIDDNGGIKAAYDAYIEWTKTNKIEELRLPGLNYSPQQMFWISAASRSCSKFSKKYLENYLTTNKHSPAEARVKLPLRNSVKFAEDFGCKPNAKMNPVKKCELW